MTRKHLPMEGQLSLLKPEHLAAGEPVLAREALLREMAECQLCTRSQMRTGGAFARGASVSPRLAIVGEAPTWSEDAARSPFGGPAGELVSAMLRAAGIPEDRVWFTNAVGCPGVGAPKASELKACRTYLTRHLALVAPSVILCMGTIAARAVLDRGVAAEYLTDRWHMADGVPVRVTTHPNAVLAAPPQATNAMKRTMWVDILAVLERLGMPVPTPT